MPVTPYPIDLTLYDTDNTTLKADAKFFIRNITKKTSTTEETTDSAGVAQIDLANLPLGNGQTLEYEDGDEVLIIAYDGKNSDALLHVVDTATGSYSATLKLNPLNYVPGSSQRIMQMCGGNTAASVAYFKVYAVDDGELLAHVEVPANDTRYVEFGRWGKGASGGFVVEREAATLIVTATLR